MESELSAENYIEIATIFFTLYLPESNGIFKNYMNIFIEEFLYKLSPNLDKSPSDSDPVITLIKWLIKRKMMRKENVETIILLAKKYSLVREAVCDHINELRVRHDKIPKNGKETDEITLPIYAFEFLSYAAKNPKPKRPGPNPFINTVRDFVISLSVYLLEMMGCNVSGIPDDGTHVNSACYIVASVWIKIDPNMKAVPYENVRKLWKEFNKYRKKSFRKEFLELFIDLNTEFGLFFTFFLILENSLNQFLAKEEALFNKTNKKKEKNSCTNSYLVHT